MGIIIRVNLSLWKGKDMKEREEENLTLLGNQGVKYPTDYNCIFSASVIMETFMRTA